MRSVPGMGQAQGNSRTMFVTGDQSSQSLNHTVLWTAFKWAQEWSF